MKVGLFRKKPVVIAAMQWLGSLGEAKQIEAWADSWTEGSIGVEIDGGIPIMQIYTLEGVMTADPGDYIIKGVQGEFYPCKPVIFDATYEPIGEIAEGKLEEDG